jgi:hypothetical protein
MSAHSTSSELHIPRADRSTSLRSRFSKRKRIIALVAVWSIAISLIMIRSHFTFYLTNEKFSFYKISWRTSEGPAFGDFDLAVILIISSLIGVFVKRAKNLVYGYFTTILVSSAIVVTYIFLYNWFTLSYGESLGQIPFGWEWVLYSALLSFLRFMFPIGMIFCLIGLVAGNFIRSWVAL